MFRQKFHMIFDVESIGLHGEGFAVAYVVLDDKGVEVESNLFSCPRDLAVGFNFNPLNSDEEGETEMAMDMLRSDWEWVADNVPDLDINCTTPKVVRQRFWSEWKKWSNIGVELWAWNGWPVEARFLIQCAEDDIVNRHWQGPFPLNELSTLVRCLDYDGRDLLKAVNLNKHHPMDDVRHCAIFLREYLVEKATRK